MLDNNPDYDYAKITCERIVKRMTELNMSDVDLARKLGKGSNKRSTVNRWTNGKSAPRKSMIPELAKILNCTENYLLGIDETISADNATINKITGLLDEAIEGLNKLKNQIEDYAHCRNCKTPDNCDNCEYDRLRALYTIYENGFNYTDVISYIIGDINLWETILYEAEKTMTWHLSENYRYRFEDLLNEDGNGNRLPAEIEQKEISNLIISKAISESFNNYISKKLKELNVEELTATEHEIKSLQELKKNNKK